MNPLDTGTIVTCTFDPDAPPTPEQLAELKALDGRPIDYGDIPETPPDALRIRMGPGNLLGRSIAEAWERERAGGPFENIERLFPEMAARVAGMKDNFLDFSDMPDMAPYALTLITGEGPSLKGLMPGSERACAAA